MYRENIRCVLCSPVAQENAELQLKNKQLADGIDQLKEKLAAVASKPIALHPAFPKGIIMSENVTCAACGHKHTSVGPFVRYCYVSPFWKRILFWKNWETICPIKRHIHSVCLICGFRWVVCVDE